MQEWRRSPDSIAGRCLVISLLWTRQRKFTIAMQLDGFRVGEFDFTQRRIKDCLLQNEIESARRDEFLTLIRRWQIAAQLSGEHVGSQVFELHRIGADIFLWHQPDFEEALAI